MIAVVTSASPKSDDEASSSRIGQSRPTALSRSCGLSPPAASPATPLLQTTPAEDGLSKSACTLAVVAAGAAWVALPGPAAGQTAAGPHCRNRDDIFTMFRERKASGVRVGFDELRSTPTHVVLTARVDGFDPVSVFGFEVRAGKLGHPGVLPLLPHALEERVAEHAVPLGRSV
jgi:hypothetical protein